MLATLNEILGEARRGRYAVGSFNVPNLQAIAAVIDAAEELGCPVILAHAHNQEYIVPIEVIGPIMVQFAHRAKVPVCVHADHGATFEFCMRAIRQGFTSVMYDASAKCYEDNVRETAEVVRAAHAVGVDVEAELGHIFVSAVGAGEGRGAKGAEDYDNLEDAYTNPDTAQDFVARTGADALAIAFGTTHGVYTKTPVLDLARITAVAEKVDVPLVMHGGSGLSRDEFRGAIDNGIAKINYYTYMGKAAGEAAREFCNSGSEEVLFFHDIAVVGREAMKRNAAEAMQIFRNR